MTAEILRRCKGCRWWTEQPGDFNNEPDHIRVSGFRVRTCKCPMVLEHDRPMISSQASVQDGSNYMAVFITGPNFGCVHWKEADDDTGETRGAAQAVGS